MQSSSSLHSSFGDSCLIARLLVGNTTVTPRYALRAFESLWVASTSVFVTIFSSFSDFTDGCLAAFESLRSLWSKWLRPLSLAVGRAWEVPRTPASVSDLQLAHGVKVYVL